MTPVSERDDVIEGYSVGAFGRVCGALFFFGINPLFVYVWIDRPRFVQGAVDFPEIFMAIVTAGMLLLGCCGLMINFAKTRVSADALEWRGFRRHRLDLDQIRSVESVVRLSALGVPVVSIMRLVSIESRKIELAGGTSELHRTFLRLQSEYPK